ncbi:hypothetical protein N7532_000346 [Penicillium argentinense]|uniref:Uncharacterized protein n=1 Tax=Penicillium argentinense TaxID=1131581 RepID=A0A9W9G530_9EURO|nr:uncharacterized protein N7532_000346 [Penicillium argentinense]KAJ5112301.1 hypothetical protein N7532_000346 [Penicillium argentinense]
MLRRRFSRESKASGEHRDPTRFGFPFNIKSIKPASKIGSKPDPDLTMLGDLGSSLMSERGYDSDAQFVMTPPRNGPLARPRAARPLRRMELSDLIEQSHERIELEHQWAIANGRNNSESHQSASAMQPTTPSPSSVKSSHGPVRTLRIVSQSPNQHRAPLEARFNLRNYDMKMKSAKSLPNLNVTNQQSTPPSHPLSGSVTLPQLVDKSTLVDDWSWPTLPNTSNPPYGKESSDTPSDQSPDLMVKKNRQPSHSARTFTDPRSIHFDELGISRQLASQTTASGSMSCNPSMTGLIHPNEHGFYVISPSQDNSKYSPKSGVSLGSGNDSPSPDFRQRELSSLSPPSGSASPHVSYRLFPPTVASKPAARSSNFQEDKTNQSGPDETGLFQASCGLRSKFKEHCESDESEPAQSQSAPANANEICSPRRVSIGWMSGGRRFGYGYNPVPNDEEKQSQLEGDDRPCRNPGLFSKAEGAPGNSSTKASSEVNPEHQKNFAESTEKPIQRPGQEIADNDPTFKNNSPASVSKCPLPRSASDFPAPPYLRAILGGVSNRSQVHETRSSGDQGARSLRTPELPPTTQTEHCEVPQSSEYTKRASGAFANRWSRIRSASRLSQTPTKSFVRSGDNADDEGPEYFDLDDQENAQDQTPTLQHSNSRGARWTRRFSRRKESRRLSNKHQQDVSQASSNSYQDCESEVLGHSTSTKSNGPEEAVSTDQDCLEMPGSFDGSHWASRKSRMLWDACTEGLRR